MRGAWKAWITATVLLTGAWGAFALAQDDGEHQIPLEYDYQLRIEPPSNESLAPASTVQAPAPPVIGSTDLNVSGGQARLVDTDRGRALAVEDNGSALVTATLNLTYSTSESPPIEGLGLSLEAPTEGLEREGKEWEHRGEAYWFFTPNGTGAHVELSYDAKQGGCPPGPVSSSQLDGSGELDGNWSRISARDEAHHGDCLTGFDDGSEIGPVETTGLTLLSVVLLSALGIVVHGRRSGSDRNDGGSP